MKVSYVTMRFPAPSEAFAAVEIRELQRAGLDVAVHAMRGPGPDAARLTAERRLTGLPVSQGTRAADARGVLAALRRPVLAARLVLWVIRCAWKQPVQLATSLALVPRSIGILVELQARRPDVVHLFWGHYPSLVGYLVVTELPGTVLTMFLGAYDLTRSFGGSTWLASRADAVITHARCNAPVIEALGVPPGRILVAYRGIDLTCFDAGPVPKRNRHIVAAGRLETAKAMDHVLLAFREVRAHWPDATLTIVGSGPQRAALARLAHGLGVSDAVEFIGHVPQSELARVLSEADVFVHLSWETTERLPNVLKEAMASRCLCIAADSPGIEELVQPGRTGILVARGDWKAAASRIDDVCAGRIDAASMRAHAARHVSAHFDVTRSMEAYRGCWARVAAGRRRTTAPIAGMPQATSTVRAPDASLGQAGVRSET